MDKNDELLKIISNAIGSHQSLDHKLHLLEALGKVFDKADKYQQLRAFYGNDELNDRDCIQSMWDEVFSKDS